jgi:two-component system response regulator HydG
MFGHVKGAFTGAVDTTKGKFEIANGGTLLLDEIANISIQVQARLLRVVQEQEIFKIGSTHMKKVNVRIVSATNRNLHEEVEAGNFRNDLFYRLNVVHIHIPALRERPEDIPVLSEYFLGHLSRNIQKTIQTISPEAIQRLQTYHWPGNVRELKNVIERAVVTCESGIIEPDDIILGYQPFQYHADKPQPSNKSLADLEREQIKRVLKEQGGNRNTTAQQLGIHRKTLREKIRKYGISVD